MDHQIIFSDTNVLVLNKPAGLPVLPDGWDSNAPFLVKSLEREFGKIWVVHRLDKSTSGVMVFARTAEAHRVLNRQFELHEAWKIYHAIVVGVPLWDEKIAKHPLRINVGHRHRTVAVSRVGRHSSSNRISKASETHFKVLERYRSHTLLEAQPVTGRTHQVRVHASALGYSLLGDMLYGSGAPDLISRPALHAVSLTLRLPEHEHDPQDPDEWMPNTEQYSPTTFSAPYPEDFSEALQLISSK